MDVTAIRLLFGGIDRDSNRQFQECDDLLKNRCYGSVSKGHLTQPESLENGF